MTAVAANAFVVLLGFCSLQTGDCGLVRNTPSGKPAYTTQKECIDKAKALDSDVKEQTHVLSVSDIKGPWAAHAVCVTMQQALQTASVLHAWDAARPIPEDKPERPGERDPAPHGG